MPRWVTTATRPVRSGSRAGSSRRAPRPTTAGYERPGTGTSTVITDASPVLHVGVVIADELVEGVAAELAHRLRRQHEGDHRLAHHPHRGPGGDVGALLEAHRPLLGAHVDG